MMDPSQKMWSKLLGVILFVAYIRSAVSDGVLGCGGFVKSDVEINFSLVEVSNLYFSLYDVGITFHFF